MGVCVMFQVTDPDKMETLIRTNKDQPLIFKRLENALMWRAQMHNVAPEWTTTKKTLFRICYTT